jgi:hypothetical protein
MPQFGTPLAVWPVGPDLPSTSRFFTGIDWPWAPTGSAGQISMFLVRKSGNVVKMVLRLALT